MVSGTMRRRQTVGTTSSSSIFSCQDQLTLRLTDGLRRAMGRNYAGSRAPWLGGNLGIALAAAIAGRCEVTTMKFLFLACILPQLALAATATTPEPSQPMHVVVYVDVLASAASRAAAALKAYRTESRREPGASGIDVFAQEGRASGFAIVEVWQDGAAFETHGKAAAIERLRREMKPMQLAPLDVRVHTAYS